MMKTSFLSLLALMILGCASDREPLTPRQQRALEVAAQRAAQDKASEATSKYPAPSPAHSQGKTPLSAQAVQSMSVASLLKAGGKQLETEELRELLKGAAWEGPLPGGWYRTQLRADGRYQNTLLSHGEKNMDSHGYWYVDPQARVCSQPANEAAAPRCSVWFQLRNQYYVGGSSEPSARLTARKLIR